MLTDWTGIDNIGFYSLSRYLSICSNARIAHELGDLTVVENPTGDALVHCKRRGWANGGRVTSSTQEVMVLIMAALANEPN